MTVVGIDDIEEKQTGISAFLEPVENFLQEQSTVITQVAKVLLNLLALTFNSAGYLLGFALGAVFRLIPLPGKEELEAFALKLLPEEGSLRTLSALIAAFLAPPILSFGLGAKGGSDLVHFLKA